MLTKEEIIRGLSGFLAHRSAGDMIDEKFLLEVIDYIKQHDTTIKYFSVTNGRDSHLMASKGEQGYMLSWEGGEPFWIKLPPIPTNN